MGDIQNSSDQIVCLQDWSVGCGVSNARGTIRCSNCGNMLQSPANNNGEVFEYGQSIYFYRRSGEVLEAGRCVCFTEDLSNGSVIVRVKYANKDYSADKFDERHSLNNIFSSIESASKNSSRSRRRSVPFTAAVSASKPVTQQQSTTDISFFVKAEDMDQDSEIAIVIENKNKKPKKVASEETLLIKAESPPLAEDGSLSAAAEEKRVIQKPKRSFKDSDCDEKDKLIKLNFEKQTDHLQIQRARLDSKANGSRNGFRVNGAFDKEEFVTNGDSTLDSNGDSASFALNTIYGKFCTMSKTIRRSKLEDIFDFITFDNPVRYPAASTSITNEFYFTLPIRGCESRGNRYRVALDVALKRGLISEIVNWAVPIRLDAEIEELGAKAWKSDVFVIEVEEIIQALPLTIDDMAKLNCGERLTKLPLHPIAQGSENHPGIDESNGSSSSRIGSNDSSSSSSSGSGNNVDITESVAAALVDIVCRYLEGRGALVEDTEASQHDTVKSDIYNRQRLPMTYNQFKDIIAMAYWEFGGRDMLEGSKEVKGSKIVSGVATMYGGLKENVIQTIIERTNCNKHSIFLDVGSGIGQICIQVAATVGCKCIGIELDPDRHQSAIKLVQVFDSILLKEGFTSGISDLISLHCASIMDCTELINSSSHIFFNNFGPWFSIPVGLNKETPTQRFCSQLVGCKIGTQICVLNPLVEVSDWLHYRQFESGREGFSWTSHSIFMHLYTVLSDQWKCQTCTILNPIGVDDCLACYTVRKSRRTGKSTFICR